MMQLRKKALKDSVLGKPWCAETAFASIASGRYDSKDGVTIKLNASIADVQAVIAKSLKPNRRLLSVVKFSNGKMEEMRMTRGEDGTSKAIIPAVVQKDGEEEKPEPKAAVTVAAPVIGCPVPEFPESVIRATRVLEEFLTPLQLSDYRRHGRFVAQGADTGTRYMITNRELPREAKKSVSLRSLFDLDKNMPLCVHDWDVPAPEEMLALLLCISMPGNEKRIRHLPEVWA